MRRQHSTLAPGATCVIALLLTLGCRSTLRAPLASETSAAESVPGSRLDAVEAHERPHREDRFVWSKGFEAYEFRISEGAFDYEFTHCTGVGESARGAVKHVGQGRLVLAGEADLGERAQADSSSDPRRVFRLEREMYAVPWCDETFLVPASLMPDFCALVNAHGADAVKHADFPRRMRSVDDSPGAQISLHDLPNVSMQFMSHFVE
jgi:hypothetical protein